MHLGYQDRAAVTELARQAKANDIKADGFCLGTSIMTLDGELPVEHLSVGDRVITRDTGMAVLRDVIRTEVEVAPIRIKAGSLGHTRPDSDMTLAPDARVHIRDWRAEAIFGEKTATVPAHRLIDGEFVARQPKQKMTLITLVFDRAHIVYANGLEMATGDL